MRALTLWRPWPWAIFHAPPELAKRIENRPWRPWPSIVGQRIALHAGKKWDAHGAKLISRVIYGFAPGHEGVAWLDSDHVHDQGIVGTAVVSSWFKYPEIKPALPTKQVPWCRGPYCWVLDEVVAFPEPISCKSAQGLWTVPAEIERAVLAEVGP